MATALQQQEMRFYDQQQSLVASQRQLIVGDIVEEMRKMRRDDRAKLAHHIDMRVDDLERRLVSKLQRLPATGMYTAEDTLDFQHPTETKGQLPQASQSLNEVTSDPQLGGLPATGIEGIRAEVCRNFRRIAAHELSVGIRDIVHVLSPEVDTQGWVRVRLQGDRGGTGFVPASVLKVVE
ncbi:hypothetical protein Pmar_PMAR024435 [Perkinsus marinus ATCC 50983]|uniref:SH3 domain-containing protein n=1 Tax=Perkinsus marinus (strain ATCC 50983 / TXsc) TaxID=423536 RepID=C5LDM4_PERM5|nr:hypothetical protein Pmar_PMAR024435 [Perkinsus marinus ATCC 50983]EER05169.1 hypothetical protein Pmar_PMAR024435 [Perkinsus marinus ATCC 50983]|eukprot:XP_002773353.1 hypothetical protein Pmar_PMAR024435 [Perkinsus marinus ATCC 50983]